MKQLLYGSVAFLLLLAAFFSGSWVNQRTTVRTATEQGERRILHYVDPMNPGNISSEPGIAPCGMPMEPVYVDDDTESGIIGGSTVPGTVRLNLKKRQLIGVQTEEVRLSPQEYTLRALGRVTPDENKTYALYTAIAGWMGEVHDSTTGSLVKKDQLMAQIRVYDYDFFTWQQRYLTELGNAGMRPVYYSPVSRSAQEHLQRISGGTRLPLPTARNTVLYKDPSRLDLESVQNDKLTGIPPGANSLEEAAMMQRNPQPLEEKDQMEPSGHDLMGTMGGAAQPEMETPGDNISQGEGMAMDHSAGGHNHAPVDIQQAARPHRMAEVQDRLGFVREDDILYATKGRLELLDLGVSEIQLSELARTGVYVTRIDFRSPVDGLVVSRNVSPKQRIERGQECFRIADISTMWIEADLYDMESSYIQPGDEALVSLPGKDAYYKATVTAVPPVFDGVTRTLKVRLEVDNPEQLLRPDMFVDVRFMLDLPAAISVPSGAVIDGGIRKVVYVTGDDGYFQPRQVETGRHFGDRLEITAGLSPGEKIVTSGNFLLDSESRMKLAAQRLMPNETEALNRPIPKVQGQATGRQMEEGMSDMTGEKAIDPVCGMSVDRDKALAAGLTGEYNGKTYSFCSEDCREQFLRNPLGFLQLEQQGMLMSGDSHAGHAHD